MEKKEEGLYLHLDLCQEKRCAPKPSKPLTMSKEEKMNQINPMSFVKLFLITFLFALIVIPGQGFSQDVIEVGVDFQPDQITLNNPPQGKVPDVRAILNGIFIQSYQITEFNVDLLFDDEFVTKAVALNPSWYHLETCFDRESIKDFAMDHDLGGTIVTATVEGSFTAVSLADPSVVIIRQFTGYDYVEIVEPGE